MKNRRCRPEAREGEYPSEESCELPRLKASAFGGGRLLLALEALSAVELAKQLDGVFDPLDEISRYIEDVIEGGA